MNIGEKIQALYQQYGDLAGISIECQKELVAIGIVNKAARAEIFLQGAQLTAYQRHNEEPILFLSKDCEYKAGSSLRGGIPICWPWFGDLKKNSVELQEQYTPAFVESASAHGFVRSIDWEVVDIRHIGEEETLITLAHDIASDNNQAWPFAASLSYEVSIGKTLSASLRVKNTSASRFFYSAALHSYFNVNHIEQTAISGLGGASYIDALQEWQRYQQQGDIRFNQETDRIYFFNEPAFNNGQLHLSDHRRVLTIESAGSASVVIWNPWIEKSQRLSQFADEDYKRMVCIETANAADDTITLEPGQEHTLSLSIA